MEVCFRYWTLFKRQGYIPFILLSSMVLSGCNVQMGVTKAGFNSSTPPPPRTLYPPGGFSITSSNSGSSNVALAWSNSPRVTSYSLMYMASGGSSFTTFSTTATSPSTISGLVAGTVYQVKVAAVNADGPTDSNEISVTVSAAGVTPIVSNFSPPTFDESTQSIITLPYADADGDLAITCNLAALTHVTVTQACACAAGVCTVGVTGTLGYNGSASFNFTVTANGDTSAPGTAAFSIGSLDDAPVASNITPLSFSKDTQSIITLSYTDTEGDPATSCALSALSNVTVTGACACAGGVCTVGVTGTFNYEGPASFGFTVSSNGATSNTGSSSFSIGALDPTLTAINITPGAFNEDVEGIITLSYNDAQLDLATDCTVSPAANISVTQACACDGAGVCTVGITGSSNYNGTASFSYTVSVTGTSFSNVASANLTINAVDDAPVATNVTPSAFNEDTQTIVTFSYTDVENNLATTCAIPAVTNVTVTQACACNGSGVCTVGVTGTANYNGAASFDYTVTDNGLTSNTATATLTITAIDDVSVAANIAPAAFNEDTQSIITLSYTDIESNLASSCTLSNLSNVTITQACACAIGICTVGVTGTTNYNGAASFDYTVTANSLTSTAKTATLSITNVNNAPVGADITPAGFNEDTQGIITLSYTDADNDLATACAIPAVTNVTVTQACSCDGAGVCTVGVTGTASYVGAASFTFNVTANTQTSTNKTATLSVLNIDDPPVSSNISPSDFTAGTQSIVTLSYTDLDSDKGTACALAGLTNVSVTQACGCNGAGVCTVGVTGSVGKIDPASFTYTVTANGALSNSSTASFNLLCPTGYIEAPPNVVLGVSGFCAMKYEAKDAGGSVATSVAAGAPWASISQANAKITCNALGAKYDMISNPEWMTIARDIESVATNWTSGIVGTGLLFRGHSDNAPANALSVTNAADPYNQTGNNGGASPEQKRTHTLTNGEVIWDLSGNLYEWVDWSLAAGLQLVTPSEKAYVLVDTQPVALNREFNTLDTKIAGGDEMNTDTWQSTDPTLTSANGIGKYNAGDNVSGGLAHRGGNWNQTTNAGLYGLDLQDAPAIMSIGFRCVYRP